MDPNATVDRIIDALRANEWEEAKQAVQDLAMWRARGGFAPSDWRGLPEATPDLWALGVTLAQMGRLWSSAGLSEEEEPTECPTCGEELDRDCQGEPRCPDCDGPCPCCFDGGGPSL